MGETMGEKLMWVVAGVLALVGGGLGAALVLSLGGLAGVIVIGGVALVALAVSVAVWK